MIQANPPTPHDMTPRANALALTRYLAGCALVSLVGIGLARLLSTAGLLPFVFGVVGIFFFILVGLIFGAVMYRFGRQHPPSGRLLLIVSALVPTLVTGLATLVFERDSFLTSTAQQILRANRINPKRSARQQARVRDQLSSYWRDHHGSDGALGYVRWAAFGSPFRCGPPDGRKLRIVHPQAGLRWLLRTIISFAAMGWAILSQVYPLGQPATAAPEPTRSDPPHQRPS